MCAGWLDDGGGILDDGGIWRMMMMEWITPMFANIGSWTCTLVRKGTQKCGRVWHSVRVGLVRVDPKVCHWSLANNHTQSSANRQQRAWHNFGSISSWEKMVILGEEEG